MELSPQASASVTESRPGSAREAGPGRRAGSPGLVLALTAVSFFMVSLDALVVVTALPAIHQSVGGSIGTLDWAVNAYALTFAAGIIIAAAAGDRFGRRRTYVTGIAVFTVASALCALAPSAGTLIAARAVQGIGAAVITPLALTILASAFPASRRGAIVGIWGGLGGLAVAGGPLVGGAVVQGLDWHWVFWINVPIGALAVLGSLLFLPAGRAAATARAGTAAARLDVPGAVLIAGGAVLLTWGLVRAGGSGWGDAAGLASLTAGLAVLAGFVAWERRAAEPMLPLRLLRNRTFATANVAGFMSFGAIMSAAFLTAQYFQLGLGYSPLAAGLRMLPWTATPMLVAPAAGALADRIGTRPLIVCGLGLQAAGLAWVSVLASGAAAGGGYGRYVLPFVVAGVGVSMVIPTVPTAVLGAVAPGDVGRASGVSNTMQRFGGAFGVALASAVFAAHGHLGSAASFTAGYRPAMLVSAGLSLAGALVAAGTSWRRTAAPETAASAGPPAGVAAPGGLKFVP
jgi:EmrB/QacA subfamily drug resistance transporter